MSLTDAQEHVIMQLAQLYAMEHLPIGLLETHFESQVDLVTRGLVLSLRAFALADDGPRFHETHVWKEYRFPWYTPKWLRRRRTITREITLTFQGKVIYPEQRMIDKLGKGSRIVEFYTGGARP